MREVRAPQVKRLRDEGAPCVIGQMLADVGPRVEKANDATNQGRIERDEAKAEAVTTQQTEETPEDEGSGENPPPAGDQH